MRVAGEAAAQSPRCRWPQAQGVCLKASLTAKVGFQCIHVSHDFLPFFQQRVAVCRKRHAACGAHEQTHIEAFFQQADMMSEGGGQHIKLLGRVAEV